MKRIAEWAMVLLFSGALLVLMAATILLPKERYSYYENRNLSAFPRSRQKPSSAVRSSATSRPCSATMPPDAPQRSRPSHGVI